MFVSTKTKTAWPLLTGSLFVLWLALAPSIAASTFDPIRGEWEFDSTDCAGPAKTWRIEKRPQQPTQIFFHSSNGTQVLGRHKIPPSFVIPEFDCAVQVKSARPGITLMVRVVFPETPNPAGIGPLTTLINGPIYRNAGRWQTLRFSENRKSIDELVQERLWVLRKKHGPQVSSRNAYIDAVFLNLYTTPGHTEISVDDLTIHGRASADSVVVKSDQVISTEDPKPNRSGDVRTIGYNEPEDRQPSLVQRDGTILKIRDKPFFPRIIQHNGESFEFLRTLGFNVVELHTPPNDFQLKEAEKLDIWLISPAPPSAGLKPIPFKYDRVLAWSVGNNLTGNELRTAQQKVIEIRQSDLRNGRPVVANVESHWDLYGRELDIMSLGLEPLGTSFIASQYSQWLKNRSLDRGNNKPFWAEIQTEMNAALQRQVTGLARGLPPTPVEPQQIKFLLYEAIAAGTRGLRFNSRNPLDSNDPATRLRAQTLRWINGHALQLEPWIAAGAVMSELEQENHHLDITALNTSRSRLLLVQRPTHHEQYWAGDTPLDTIRFRDNLSTFSDRVFLVTEHGLQPMPGNRNPSGVEIQIENCPYSAAVVLAQDPQIVSQLSQPGSAVNKNSLLRQHLDITQQWLAIMQLVENQVNKMRQTPALSGGAINEAILAFRKATDLAGTSPSMARPFLDRADERLAFARRELLSQPLGQFQSKTSTPFLAHISLVPLHWQLASKLANKTWKPNSLPAGDFESLARMKKSGWENMRVSNLGVSSKVQLSPDARTDGEYGLKIAVRPTQNVNVVQAKPIWISSSPIPVKVGQLIRIHGWVNVPKVITATHDGLTIMESIGGPDLAERISITEGWQEFTLYRTVSKNTDLVLTFTLTGVGEAMIDEVTVRAIDLLPASTANSSQLQPLRDR